MANESDQQFFSGKRKPGRKKQVFYAFSEKKYQQVLQWWGGAALEGQITMKLLDGEQLDEAERVYLVFKMVAHLSVGEATVAQNFREAFRSFADKNWRPA